MNAQLGKAGFDDAMIAALAGEDVLAADETPVSVLDKTAAGAAGRGRRGEGPGGEGREGRARRAARADHPDPGRAADVPAGHGLAAEGRPRGRAPGRVHRVPDHRRLHRLPAPSVPAGRHPAMLRPRHPPLPRGHETRPRRRPGLGRRRHRDPARALTGPSRPPAPAGTPPWTSRYSMTCANATTPRSAPGSSTTGCGTGTTGTTPATPSAPGCATTRNRSSCSPATSP